MNNTPSSSQRSTVWIIASVLLLVVFGGLAFLTGNGVWWSVFGIAVAAFGALWWVILPAIQKRRDNRNSPTGPNDRR